MRGATIKLYLVFNYLWISIHTPHAGSDPRPSTTLRPAYNFNPHSPCGERQRWAVGVRHCRSISIHTPHAGSDGIVYGFSHFPKISIHTPHAGSDVGILHLMHRAFDISIHTPHAGSDFSVPLSQHPFPDFNPHSPCGERRMMIFGSVSSMPYFNPHSPCGERPALQAGKFVVFAISIHTPHAGSDFVSRSAWFRIQQFQSTLPMRGATIKLYLVFNYLWISIHTPHAGSDPRPSTTLRPAYNFNPHSPCGERRFSLRRKVPRK